jgi:hypothetical protein
MTIVRLPTWGLTVADGWYYGYRYGAHLGPWLVLFWPVKVDE